METSWKSVPAPYTAEIAAKRGPTAIFDDADIQKDIVNRTIPSFAILNQQSDASFYRFGVAQTTDIIRNIRPRFYNISSHRGHTHAKCYGVGAPSVVTTLASGWTSLGTASAIEDGAAGVGTRYTTAGASGDDAGAQMNSAGANLGKLRNYPYLSAKIRTGSDISSQFIYIAFDNGASLGSSAPAGVTLYGLYYNDAVSANWQIASRKAADGAGLTLSDTGLVVAASTVYVTEFWYDGVNLTAKINDKVATTGIGAMSTSEAGLYCGVNLVTTAAVVRFIDIYDIYYDQE